MDQELAQYLDERFAGVDLRFAEIRREFAEMRGELAGVRGEFEAVRGEVGAMRGQVATVREESGAMRGELAAVHGEVGQMRGEFEAVRGQMQEGFDEVKRHNGILIEDLRYKVQLVAEGFATFVEGRYTQDQVRIDERFRETHALIRSTYNHLNQRVENLERKGLN
jgi:predicted nuclease with TOPRIM domain